MSMMPKVEYWTNERCNNIYSEPLGIKCVKEKGHQDKHVFYVDWSDWT